MKKLLLLIFLISANIFSQEVVQDYRLSGHLLQFMKEATDRGYNINRIIYSKLVAIEIANLDYPNIGSYTPYSKTIKISPYALIDKTLTKITIYHELGHVLKIGAPHTCKRCTDIMSSAQYISICYYKDKDTWDKELDKLFKWAIDE